jgi:succinoglycan biosynthesis protein ExoM
MVYYQLFCCPLYIMMKITDKFRVLTNIKEHHHISVCICTYRRPQLLARLLQALGRQQAEGLFSLSVVVVDNDVRQSALDVVKAAANGKVALYYDIEPVKNIALARNRAVRKATGTHLAFLDDDELPIDSWLLHLYQTCLTHDADGVLGPVKPEFVGQPPPWIVKGGICERKSYTTGTILRRCIDTRTGNVLFNSRIFAGVECPFDPRFGETGGEDTDFFRRMMNNGHTFVWCDEAEVYETVPPERQTRSYYLRRALLRGVVAFRKPKFQLKIFSVAKSFVAVIIYTPLLLIFLLAGSHAFMKYLIRYCDHLGKLMAAIGLDVVKEHS